MKRTWQEKLIDKDFLPKVLKLEKGFHCYNAILAYAEIRWLSKPKVPRWAGSA